MNDVRWRWLLVILFAATSARADDPQDGFLDRRFGTNGLTLVSYDQMVPNDQQVTDLARFTNGRLYQSAIVKINTAGGARYRTAVARLLSNGALDNSFSGDGKVVLTSAEEQDFHTPSTRVIAQSDGKPLVLSARIPLGGNGLDSKMQVCRLTAAGTKDATFDQDGCAHPVLGLIENGLESPIAMTLAPDGGILILAQVIPPSQGEQHIIGAVYKLTAQGARDDSFGQGAGFVLVKPPVCDDCYYWDLHALNDGSIVLGGTDYHMLDFVSKLTPSGSMDGSFGAGGHSIYSYANLHQMGATVDYLSRLALDSQGRIYACGGLIAQNPSTGLIAVARMNANGQLDPAFANGGRLLRPVVDVVLQTEVRSCAVDAMDRLVIAGSVAIGNDVDSVVLRLLSSGEPDTRFNQTGHTILPINLNGLDGDDQAKAMVLDGDGIVVAGNAGKANPSENKLSVIRLGSETLLKDGFE